ncbi:hypothetical protein [Stackebrandtia nassauensis]|uniref:Lipoprotein n=1 Tax=Stackebrandtia nassauensis (strain DSM 44728 / CIP 108903 / NRRL B-16338 / NBRC 102104 / LLR-40K-21) TaxID=446470 RepID=D3Q5R4_STANL|nr:hypothetical protein [Stackebrandtia nassauensis]ADD40213.1 hypothetical protein Snas_0498 [Stackebrandtia nassauensis DSM 44728]
MRAVAWLLVAALALSGCGSQVDAEEWAADVCAALEPWKTGIEDLTAEANAAMDPESSPTQAKKDLLKLLAGAADISEDARAGIEAAGVPDIADGERMAKRFTESLAATRDAYRTAHDRIEKLDAGKGDFYDEVAAAMKQLAKDYDAVPQVAELDSEELKNAFEAVKQCQ